MATVADVEKILARARHLRDRIQSQRGPDATWEFTFPDGITERYTIRGLESVEGLEIDVASLFVWAWSMKDYLFGLAKARGHDPQRVINLVARTPALQLVADVANTEKHAELERKSWTGKKLTLGPAEYSIELRAIQKIEMSARENVITPTTPDAVQVFYPVRDSKTGQTVADAIVLLAAAIGYWEKALAELLSS